MNNINLLLVQGKTYIEWGIIQACERRILDKSIYSEIIGKFGVLKSTLTYSLSAIFTSFKCSSLKHLWYIMGVGKITKRTVREVIEKIVDKGKMVNKTYLIKDKEAYIVEKSEIYGAHGIPIYI